MTSRSQRFQRNGLPTILATLALFVGVQAVAPTPAAAMQTDTCQDANGKVVICQDPAGGGPADGGATEDRDWDNVTDGTQDGGAAKGTGGDSYGEESVASSDPKPTDTAPAPAIGPQNPTSETWTNWTGTGLGDYKDIQVSTDWKSWTATNVMCPNLLPQLRDLSAQLSDDLDLLDQAHDIRSSELRHRLVGEIRNRMEKKSFRRAHAIIQWRSWDCESVLGAVGD